MLIFDQIIEYFPRLDFAAKNIEKSVTEIEQSEDRADVKQMARSYAAKLKRKKRTWVKSRDFWIKPIGLELDILDITEPDIVLEGMSTENSPAADFINDAMEIDVHTEEQAETVFEIGELNKESSQAEHSTSALEDSKSLASNIAGDLQTLNPILKIQSAKGELPFEDNVELEQPPNVDIVRPQKSDSTSTPQILPKSPPKSKDKYDGRDRRSGTNNDSRDTNNEKDNKTERAKIHKDRNRHTKENDEYSKRKFEQTSKLSPQSKYEESRKRGINSVELKDEKRVQRVDKASVDVFSKPVIEKTVNKNSENNNQQQVLLDTVISDSAVSKSTTLEKAVELQKTAQELKEQLLRQRVERERNQPAKITPKELAQSIAKEIVNSAKVVEEGELSADQSGQDFSQNISADDGNGVDSEILVTTPAVSENEKSKAKSSTNTAEVDTRKTSNSTSARNTSRTYNNQPNRSNNRARDNYDRRTNYSNEYRGNTRRDGFREVQDRGQGRNSSDQYRSRDNRISDRGDFRGGRNGFSSGRDERTADRFPPDRTRGEADRGHKRNLDGSFCINLDPKYRDDGPKRFKIIRK
jgi:hypothetical protein